MGTADCLTATGGETHTGPGYTFTLHTTGARPAGFTLDLARAPGLHYTRTNQPNPTQPEPP